MLGRNISIGLCGAAALLAATGVQAQARRVQRPPAQAPAQQVQHPPVQPVVSGYRIRCQPCCGAEFVNDVRIWNDGNLPVPQGTRVHWKVLQSEGDHTFAAALAPGAQVMLTNVIRGSINAPCTVEERPAAVSPGEIDRNLPLFRLGAPNPQFQIGDAGFIAAALQARRTEISCGIFVHPQPNNPNAASRNLFIVNNTDSAFPPGTRIEYEVDGVPSWCCKGQLNGITFWLQPNPPTVHFAYTTNNPIQGPPQPFTRPVRCWATLPK